MLLHKGELEIESKTAHESADGSRECLEYCADVETARPSAYAFRECFAPLSLTFRLGRSHLPPEALAASNPEIDTSTDAAQFGRDTLEEVALWHKDSDRDDAESTSAVSSQEAKRSRAIDSGMFNFKRTDVVLIVEDMPDAQRYLRSILEPYCKVVVAREGQEALRMWDTHPPDLVISDLMLPGVSTKPTHLTSDGWNRTARDTSWWQSRTKAGTRHPALCHR